MQRREFIIVIAGAAALPTMVRAQQPIIGFLNSASPDTYAPMLAAFHQGLREAGLAEGQDVTIEYRWANGQYDRLPAMAAELVRRQVMVIVATSTPAALAARAATTTIPIVFTSTIDPVKLDFVSSLARPDRNLTGTTLFAGELAGKLLELVSELLPRVTVVGLLVNSRNPMLQTIQETDAQDAARRLQRQLVVVNASAGSEIDAAFASLVQQRVGALLVSADPFFVSRRAQLTTLVGRHAIPTIFPFREDAEAGGLMSYGNRLTEVYQQAGNYAGRILKGAKPADLPVLRPTKFELVINMKTVKALAIDVPPMLLARADELIE